MSPPVCAICADELAYHRACDQCHADLCHPCWSANLSQSFDGREHLAPAPSLTLSPRDVAALVRYRIHKQTVLGTGPLGPHVVREED